MARGKPRVEVGAHWFRKSVEVHGNTARVFRSINTFVHESTVEVHGLLWKYVEVM